MLSTSNTNAVETKKSEGTGEKGLTGAGAQETEHNNDNSDQQEFFDAQSELVNTEPFYDAEEHFGGDAVQSVGTGNPKENVKTDTENQYSFLEKIQVQGREYLKTLYNQLSVVSTW